MASVVVKSDVVALFSSDFVSGTCGRRRGFDEISRLAGDGMGGWLGKGIYRRGEFFGIEVVLSLSTRNRVNIGLNEFPWKLGES